MTPEASGALAYLRAALDASEDEIITRALVALAARVSLGRPGKVANVAYQRAYSRVYRAAIRTGELPQTARERGRAAGRKASKLCLY